MLQDEAPFYCVSRAHDAARHARSFHLAAPEVAPFLQSAERFPPGPPFRAPGKYRRIVSKRPKEQKMVIWTLCKNDKMTRI